MSPIHTMFKMFLKKARLLRKFKKNLQNGSPYSSIEQYVTSLVIINKREPSALINAAFFWERTSEGHEFWRTVDLAWMDYLRSNNVP